MVDPIPTFSLDTLRQLADSPTTRHSDHVTGALRWAVNVIEELVTEVNDLRLALYVPMHENARRQQTADRKAAIYKGQIRQMQERIRELKAQLNNAREGLANAQVLAEIRMVLEANNCPHETTTTRALMVMSILSSLRIKVKNARSSRDAARKMADALADENGRLRQELRHAETINVQCVFCGIVMHSGTEVGACVAAHVVECEKHPLRAEIKRLTRERDQALTDLNFTRDLARREAREGRTHREH